MKTKLKVTPLWMDIHQMPFTFQITFCLEKFSKSFTKQDSPPAWTHEADYPSNSKCSFCCSVWEGDIPSSPGWGGVPHAVAARGYHILSWSILHHPPGIDLGPVTGVLPRKDMGSVEILCDEVPPPWKGHGTSGSIMGWRWGTLPCVWTDRHLWKEYLLHLSDAGSN